MSKFSLLRHAVRVLLSEKSKKVAYQDALESSDYDAESKSKILNAISSAPGVRVGKNLSVKLQSARGGGIHHIRTQPIGGSEEKPPLDSAGLFSALTSAGFLPAGDNGFLSTSTLASGKSPTYAFADPETGMRYFIVLGGGAKLKKEELQTQALSNAISALGSVLVSPAPSSKNDELRRPRPIIGVSKVPGTPKADIALQGNNENDTVYLSLKDGETPKDFQQYGGMTQLNQLPIARDFIRSVIQSSEVIDDSHIKLPAKSFYKSLAGNDAKELKIIAIYGPDAWPVNKSKKSFGVNKVHLLLQAPVPTIEPLSKPASDRLKKEFGIKSKEIVYQLQGAHMVMYPNIPSGDYEPVLHARPDNSTPLNISSFFTAKELKDMGLSSSISGVRFLVYPLAKLPSSSQDIDNF